MVAVRMHKLSDRPKEPKAMGQNATELGQEISGILYNQTVHLHVHKGSPLVPTSAR
jgi:hypothetical protein